MNLINEKELTLTDDNSADVNNPETRTFYLSKIPATVARRIVVQYPSSILPKVGDYDSNEKAMLKLLSYVDVVTPNGDRMRLTSLTIIDNHIPSWEMLIKLEAAQVNYNCSFFRNGQILDFLKGFAQKLPASLTKTLTRLSPSSSANDLPRSES